MINYKPQALCVIQTNFVDLLWVSKKLLKVHVVFSSHLPIWCCEHQFFLSKVHVMFSLHLLNIVVNVKLFVKANLCHVLLIFVDLLWVSTFVEVDLVSYVVSIEFSPKTHHICQIIEGWGQVIQTQPIAYLVYFLKV